MPDVAALHRTLEHIETHPDEWDQGSWAKCFAGITLRLTRPELTVVPDADCLCGNCAGLERPNGEYVGPDEIAYEARRILGLTDGQAGYLFSVVNRLDDIRRLVAEFASEAAA